MRQMITRIDEVLLERLKARAAEEGRSVNALVTDVLASAVMGTDERALLRSRLRALGLEVVPPRPRGRVPSRDKAIATTRGAGRAGSKALASDRDAR